MVWCRIGSKNLYNGRIFLWNCLLWVQNYFGPIFATFKNSRWFFFNVQFSLWIILSQKHDTVRGVNDGKSRNPQGNPPRRVPGFLTKYLCTKLCVFFFFRLLHYWLWMRQVLPKINIVVIIDSAIWVRWVSQFDRKNWPKSDLPYAIVIDGSGKVSEFNLGDHSQGQTLAKSVQIVSNEGLLLFCPQQLIVTHSNW